MEGRGSDCHGPECPRPTQNYLPKPLQSVSFYYIKSSLCKLAICLVWVLSWHQSARYHTDRHAPHFHKIGTLLKNASCMHKRTDW